MTDTFSVQQTAEREEEKRREGAETEIQRQLPLYLHSVRQPIGFKCAIASESPTWCISVILPDCLCWAPRDLTWL